MLTLHIKVESSPSTSQTLLVVTLSLILANLSNFANLHFIHLAVNLCLSDLQKLSNPQQPRCLKQSWGCRKGSSLVLRDQNADTGPGGFLCDTHNHSRWGNRIHQKSKKPSALCSQRTNKPGGKARSKQSQQH